MKDITTSQIIIPIITSLIASILFVVFNKILKKIGPQIIAYFIKINKKYSNRLYRNIPIINPNEIILKTYLYIGFLIFFTFLSFFFIINLQFEINYVRNDIFKNDIKANIEFAEKSIMEFDTLNDSRSDSILNIAKNFNINEKSQYILKIKKEIQEKVEKIKKNRDHFLEINCKLNEMEEHGNKNNNLILTFVLIILVLLLISFIIEKSQYQFIINKKFIFEKDLILIRPYIKDYEYFDIQQKWYLIKNSEDYEKVYNIINEHLKKIEGYIS